MNEKKQTIINAARSVFLKYGYKRVTINDIAKTAGISRPTLYQIFANKEEILKAVSQYHYVKSLEEMVSGINRLSSPQKKLEYAFEIWSIRMFELMTTSPEAADLVSICNAISKDVYIDVGLRFEAQLTSILKPLVTKNSKMTAEKLAHIMRHAVRGFKEAAQDFGMSSKELRQMIKDFIKMSLLSLECSKD